MKQKKTSKEVISLATRKDKLGKTMNATITTLAKGKKKVYKVTDFKGIRTGLYSLFLIDKETMEIKYGIHPKAVLSVKIKLVTDEISQLDQLEYDVVYRRKEILNADPSIILLTRHKGDGGKLPSLVMFKTRKEYQFY